MICAALALNAFLQELPSCLRDFGVRQTLFATLAILPGRGTRPPFDIQRVNAHFTGSQGAAKIFYTEDWIVTNAISIEDSQAYRIV